MMPSFLRLFVIPLTLLAAISSAGASDAPGKPITLEDFLTQVRARHGGVQAASTASQGALERSEEADLITSPLFFANAGRSMDEKPNPFLSYRSLTTDSYSLGVGKQTMFGLQAKLSYTLMKSDYDGIPVGFGPNPPTYFEGRPQIELTQSLWRNGFGSETRATREAAQASAMASHFAEGFKLKTFLAEAELAFWKLALVREKVSLSREGLVRSQKLFDWSSRRAKLQLADKADALQAEAALDARQLELQTALDDQRSAERAFNLARGVSSDEVSETLSFVETDILAQIKVPERAELRDDVLAAQHLERASHAGANLAVERARPSLDIFGTFAYNSKEATSSRALNDSFKSTRPSVMFGVKFTAPLDFWAVASTKSGWAKEKLAAEMTYQRKILEQDSDWTDLNQRLSESKRRLELALKFEDAQKRKLTHERDRLNRGRTTTFQVLLFEQDFTQAQLARIQVEADIISIIVRMKTFRSQS